MLRTATVVTAVLFAIISVPLYAIDPDHDFSGKWLFDARSSRVQALPAPPEDVLTIAQHESSIQCASQTRDGAAGRWTYLLDGAETRYRHNGETRSSIVKWEGAALLINTIVSGPRNYTIMDRWRLSPGHSTLTVTRQVVERSGEVEGVIVYRREGQPAAQPATSSPPAPPPAVAPQPALARQSAPPPEAQFTIAAGTRIPLSLRNKVDTRHSRDGDRIYLETVQPVVVNGKIVIPRGSYVNGTVTQSKRAGHSKGKSELYIRFDVLILPNGITRDFRSRLGSADSANGQVDREEGKVTGERDKAADARTVATGTGAGASVGGIAGAASGHPIGGLGAGAAAGAAVGLATIFGKRGPDASLPQGTIVEMILDRDLHFTSADLRF
jgi:cell division septation protein DedD